MVFLQSSSRRLAFKHSWDDEIIPVLRFRSIRRQVGSAPGCEPSGGEAYSPPHGPSCGPSDPPIEAIWAQQRPWSDLRD
ncbi:MAG: hypothetical protein D6723_18960 [Acidobacteria bacterium]|nr:MAG: hypothetical protein D6723_18960 [Acidobacteriota bacterium]